LASQFSIFRETCKVDREKKDAFAAFWSSKKREREEKERERERREIYGQRKRRREYRNAAREGGEKKGYRQQQQQQQQKSVLLDCPNSNTEKPDELFRHLKDAIKLSSIWNN
jgi:hypothetical protein